MEHDRSACLFSIDNVSRYLELVDWAMSSIIWTRHGPMLSSNYTFYLSQLGYFISPMLCPSQNIWAKSDAKFFKQHFLILLTKINIYLLSYYLSSHIWPLHPYSIYKNVLYIVGIFNEFGIRQEEKQIKLYKI